MIDAVMEYGIYDRSVKPQPKPAPVTAPVTAFTYPKMVTPWEVEKGGTGRRTGGRER